jgi:hypothetical protein
MVFASGTSPWRPPQFLVLEHLLLDFFRSVNALGVAIAHRAKHLARWRRSTAVARLIIAVMPVVSSFCGLWLSAGGKLAQVQDVTMIRVLLLVTHKPSNQPHRRTHFLSQASMNSSCRIWLN